ncbi:gamete antigen 27/25 [Plasmodium brasilianum]|uniref:Gamete antigen 27/25 n=1 Tax=Plasmodium brasilianum TaxID=5824 RepID=A0ACB9Y1T8_PLABR|nr:gamete antigen 27/25 [Plasmodium brasilianum]
MCASGSRKEENSTNENDMELLYYPMPYRYVYEYNDLENGHVREEVKKLGNVEFNASTDFMYSLLKYGSNKKIMLREIEKTKNISNVLKDFEEIYEYHLNDDESRKKCIRRIQKRIRFIVNENTLTEKYCKQAQEYFWIEQRLDEEMSAKVDNQNTEEEKKDMCQNEAEIKNLLSVLEEKRSIKLPNGMIENTVSTVEDFLLDVLRRTSKITVPS